MLLTRNWRRKKQHVKEPKPGNVVIRVRAGLNRAFTLLEVLLTLAMSVVLMGLIGTAFHLRG